MTSRFVKEVGRNYNQEAPTSGPGSGTVTSVAMTVPSGLLTITGTPITSSGTLAVGLVNQLANTVFAGPVSGAESAPTFRALVSDDIPSLDASKIASGTLGVARGGTGATTLTGIVIGNGTSAFTALASTTSGQLLRVNTLGTAYEWFTPSYLTPADVIATTPLVWNSGTNTMSIGQATNSTDGYLSSSDWLTFSSKQNAITLTTTGNSGAATLVGATLNIPEYTLAGLGGMSNPMTSLGDMIYGNAAGAPLRRSGNTTTTKMFLSQTGDGTSSAAPQWSVVTASDVNAVPYTGATGNVNLGEYGITAGYFGVDLTPTGTPTTQGTMYWDDNAETVALIMNGTIQKIGEDTFFHVRNTTGTTIPKGTAVRFAGTTGNSGRLLIAPMLADGTYPSQYYMGITAEDITNNQDGKVYHFGKMRGVNTSAFNDGDILYVSTSVAGGFQTTSPVAPNNIIIAAAVVHSANNGTLMIRGTLGSNIKADEGVKLTSLANNDILRYNSSNGLFENETKATFLSGVVPTSRTLTINDVVYDLSANREWSVGDYGTW